MERSTFTETQIVAILKQADARTARSAISRRSNMLKPPGTLL
jgi:hypothetical protein